MGLAVLPVLQEALAPLALQGALVLLEPKVRKVKPEFRAVPGPQGHLVPPVLLDLLDLLDLLVQADKMATSAELRFIIPLKLIPQTLTRVQEI